MRLYKAKAYAYERPTVLAFDAHVRFNFAPAGENATTVSCVVELAMKGAIRVLEPLPAPMIRRQIERERPASLSRALPTSGSRHQVPAQ